MKKKLATVVLVFLIFFQLCSFTWLVPIFSIIDIFFNLYMGLRPLTDPYISRGYYINGIRYYSPLYKLIGCPCYSDYGFISLYFWLVLISFILFILYYYLSDRTKKSNKRFFWYFIIHGIWKILLLMFFCPSSNFTF
jgi:hypothetical protein